jgi:ADP-ribose pyrophosphatase YjhB (NUDIX family)
VIAFTQDPSSSSGERHSGERPSGEHLFLMIRRKDGFGFIEFIRGKYSLSNIAQIQNILDEMSLPEKLLVLEESYESLCKLVWGTRNLLYHKCEDISSQKKFELLKSGIYVNEEFITLQMLIEKSTTSWAETEWEFPKGRRNGQEKDVECAVREFSEETGYATDEIALIDNLQPFEETFIGSNYKAYKHKYYLAKLLNGSENQDSLNASSLQRYQQTEVSQMRWATCEQCLQLIRPYNLEKKRLIENINAMLSEYRIY